MNSEEYTWGEAIAPLLQPTAPYNNSSSSSSPNPNPNPPDEPSSSSRRQPDALPHEDPRATTRLLPHSRPTAYGPRSEAPVPVPTPAPAPPPSPSSTFQRQRSFVAGSENATTRATVTTNASHSTTSSSRSSSTNSRSTSTHSRRTRPRPLYPSRSLSPPRAAVTARAAAALRPAAAEKDASPSPPPEDDASSSLYSASAAFDGFPAFPATFTPPNASTGNTRDVATSSGGGGSSSASGSSSGASNFVSSRSAGGGGGGGCGGGGEGGGTTRRVAAPVTAARVSARLVSAPGPVANSNSSATSRWRQAAAAAFASNAASVLPGTGRTGRTGGDIEAGTGAAGAGGQRDAWQGGPPGGREGGGARSRRGGGGGRGGAGGGGGVGGNGGGRRVGLESSREVGVADSGGAAADGQWGEAASVEAEVESSLGSSDTEEDSSEAVAASVEAAPPEVLRALAGSHNTIALLLLLLLHFVATHIVGIMAMFVGTTAIVGLDQRLRSHADLQVVKSRFVLVGVAVTAVLVVAMSSFVLGTFPDGEGLLGGLVFATPKRDMSTIPTVIRTTIVVDLWARLLSVTVKAVLALLVAPDNSGRGRSAGLCASCAWASGHGGIPARTHHRHRLFCCCRCLLRRFDFLRCRGREGTRRRLSPRARGESLNGGSSGSSTGGGGGISSSGSGGGGGGGGSGDSGSAGGGSRGGDSRSSCFVRRMCSTWFDACSWLPRRICGDRYRVSWYERGGEDAGGGGQRLVGEEGRGRTGGEDERDSAGAREGGAEGAYRGGVLLTRVGRQRRMYAMVEMTFMLYRSLLPVPAWLEFYGKHSEYFPVIYLILKGMEASFRTDRLVRAACYVCRGDLDRGKFATPEEVTEAGSPDCSICYDRMDRPLLLPCQHLFCGECVAEWLDRERTCPLCRAEVPTTNPIPKSVRDGRTAIFPQIL